MIDQKPIARLVQCGRMSDTNARAYLLLRVDLLEFFYKDNGFWVTRKDAGTPMEEREAYSICSKMGYELEGYNA